VSGAPARELPVFLVTGGTGQIGYELVRELAPLGRVVAPGRAELDLADPDSIVRAIRATGPDVILNAAAYTAVDRAESDHQACTRINAEAPGIIAEEARRVRAALVHYSTDYVFDGTRRTPYAEDDEPRPLQVYGRTKLAGEQAIAAVGGAYLVLRTSWVYGPRGRNFVRTILARARADVELRVVDDQIGAPTWSRQVAAGTAQIVGSLIRRAGHPAEAFTALAGVYHLTAAGETSWHGFAQEVLRRDPNRGDQRCRAVVAVSTAQYATPAVRPAYSVLDNRKAGARFGVRLPDWAEQLGAMLQP
jgi:dTDP-4-dehydrorhamnose reductase